MAIYVKVKDDGSIDHICTYDPGEGYVEAGDEVAPNWTWDGSQFVAPTIPLSAIKSDAIARIKAAATAALDAGAPVDHAGTTYHVAVADDGSRADLTAMATTAIGVVIGALSWPDKYAEGWITIENTRIPLPAPADGLQLANATGVFYATIVQQARTLKDAVLAAETAEAVAAITWED